MNTDNIRNFIPGFTMGIVRALISHPFEMLKLKTQMNVKVDKFKNLSKGIHLSILSNSVERGIQFFYFNDVMKKSNSLLYSSFYASLISTTITLPYNILLLRNYILNTTFRIDRPILIKSAGLEYGRNLSGSTLFMYTYNKLKADNFPIYACAISSSIAVWVLTYPLDNIKNQLLSNNPVRYTLQFLYKGIEYPLVRSFPSSIIGFYTYEYVNNYLNPQRK